MQKAGKENTIAILDKESYTEKMKELLVILINLTVLKFHQKNI